MNIFRRKIGLIWLFGDLGIEKKMLAAKRIKGLRNARVKTNKAEWINEGGQKEKQKSPARPILLCGLCCVEKKNPKSPLFLH
jgi:hypothetical protein